MFERVTHILCVFQPSICSNGACANRTKFHLVVSKSKFVDWQKIRVQENSSEIPSGSMPRTIEVSSLSRLSVSYLFLSGHFASRDCRAGQTRRPVHLLRFTHCRSGRRSAHERYALIRPSTHHSVKTPNTTCTATHLNLHYLSLALNHHSIGTQMSTRASGGREGHASEGVSGLKELGVKDLTYKLAFLACTVQPANARMGMTNIREDAMLNDPISFGVESDAQIPREILEMKNRTDNAQRMIRTIAPTVRLRASGLVLSLTVTLVFVIVF